MSSIRDLCRGNKRLLELAQFALSEGWDVSRTAKGHLKFTKAGSTPIFTSTTPSDYRASRNAKARLLRLGHHQEECLDG